MRFIQLPQGNGQEIYIDPDELCIKPEWIDEKSQAIVMPELPVGQNNPVYDVYKDMFKYFYDMGYKIVTDSKMAGDDSFFFTPCLDKHVNATREEYVLKKEKKINSYLLIEGITKPLTVSFPIDSFPSLLPPLPFVLKNEESQGGMEKFLIKTTEQIEILRRFYDEINTYAREKSIERVKQQWSYYKDLEFGENGHSNRGVSIQFVDYKKEFHKNMVLQEYINTPTKYNTSLRVLTSSSGDILCSSLKYSDVVVGEGKKYYGLFDRFLSDSSSPYYLGSESIVSNTVAGGESILLGRDNYSMIEQEILAAHGIDPHNADVPEDVMRACCNIAINCSREIGAIYGMDFIFDEKLGQWKYLEGHEYPMLYSYAEKYNLPYDDNSEDFYSTNQLLDIDVRLQALALTMKKRYQLQKK